MKISISGFLKFPVSAGQLRRDEVAGRLSGKKSKEEVNYRQQQDLSSTKSCAECKSYEAPGEPSASCRKVAGIVKHSDICDLYS